MKLAVFIERDGVLTQTRIENNHQVVPLLPEDFHPRTDLRPSLARLKEAGFLLFATTNQPGLSRGCLYRSDLELMHRKLMEALPLDGVLFCPHDAQDDCPCGKPKPGLLVEAAYHWHVDLERSFVVGNHWHDAKAARWAGCVSILLESPWINGVHHDFIVPDFNAAADKILRLRQAG